MDEQKYELEDMWLNFQLMQVHRGEFTFEGEAELYDMASKCLKIVNKALNVKGMKRRKKL